jgi:hypothetical protein
MNKHNYRKNRGGARYCGELPQTSQFEAKIPNSLLQRDAEKNKLVSTKLAQSWKTEGNKKTKSGTNCP